MERGRRGARSPAAEDFPVHLLLPLVHHTRPLHFFSSFFFLISVFFCFLKRLKLVVLVFFLFFVFPSVTKEVLQDGDTETTPCAWHRCG